MTDLSDVRIQLEEAMNTFARSLQPVMRSMVEIITKVAETVHTAYIEDGAIYGDTETGLMRWIEEKRKIARLRTEADELEQYHEGLKVFKRHLRERNTHHENDTCSH
jgi:hypothetical protein